MNSVPIMTNREYRAALRSDFYTFVVRCFLELNSGASFQPTPHIEAMAARLQAVRDGRVKRLIINIPPRHLKSLAASIALPAWLLGHDANAATVNVTYGFRLATSAGGVLTGRGADFVIIDDPLKPADAMSASRRAAANQWFDATLYSRLNDKTRGVIVIVMQRLHEDDLAGHALKREGWDVLAFPAIAERDETLVVETPFGRREFGRKAGEALCAERESLETLSQIRATIGEYNFAGQYQQTPAPAGSGMVKAAWFRRYRAEDLPPSLDRIVQSWAAANKPTELADYSVCTTWGLKGPNFWLLDMLRWKFAYPELNRAVRTESELLRARRDPDRGQGLGDPTDQDLIADGLSAVTRNAPDGDKIMRLHAQAATIENGFVHLSEAAPRRIHAVPERPPRRPRSIRPRKRWPGPNSARRPRA